MNLFQIESQYINLANEIIDAEGVITPEQETALELTKEALQVKGVAYGYLVKTLESESEQIDVEIKRLQAMKKSRTNLADRLKNTLKDAMLLFEIAELKTPTLKINFRNSESTIVDESIIDKKYCVEKISYQPDKKLIMQALKDGVEVVGASISYNKNIQIK